MGVGEESEWPAVLIGRGGGSKNTNVAMDAFEQLERELHAKKVREERARSGGEGTEGGAVGVRPGLAVSEASEAVGWVIYSKR